MKWKEIKLCKNRDERKELLFITQEKTIKEFYNFTKLQCKQCDWRKIYELLMWWCVFMSFPNGHLQKSFKVRNIELEHHNMRRKELKRKENEAAMSHYLNK